ncbi:ABC transporter substrate-binding protein [Tomitella biformata]|uniref:ABC transporter substrate-binding protein n=1 Tax=Tomitella biformata TaxID=630403 RepID=UPI000465EBE2|nr:ABC transporter substrate-binding protein [Tomitella biformata]
MRAQLRRRLTPLVAVAVAGGVLLAGCGSSGDAGEAGDLSAVTTGIVGNQADGGSPQDGGTLSFATYSSVAKLDPTFRQDGGATGGSEMAAIYDVLMRYDPATTEFVPQLAKSMTANSDNTVWTLTLRDGVTFSDGTPVDADAVVWSINNYLTKKGTHTQVWMASVQDMKATDAATVEFTLQRPWDGFVALFNTGPGMIVAPSSMASGEFAPIGAGPFTVEKHAPNDELVLAARADYHGGKPHIDKLRFPAIVSEQGKIDALNSGGVQAIYLRNAEVVTKALDAGNPGYVFQASLGGVLMINSREGRAGADENVRRAIVAGIDPQTYNERAEAGAGLPTSDMFPDFSEWHGDVAGSGFAPETAKKTLADAKAGGYDGKLKLVSMNDAATQQGALAFQSMLQAVGFTVDITYTNNITDLTKAMYADHDYDIAYSGFNVFDAAPFIRLYGNLYSQSPGNALGFQNPEMDELLLGLQTAKTADDKRAAADKMQTLANQTAPFVSINAGKYFIPWGANAHGITPSLDGIMLFDKAWVAQP